MYISFYLACLATKNRSSKVLSQLLSEYLHLEVSIDEFQGKWYPLGGSEQNAVR